MTDEQRGRELIIQTTLTSPKGRLVVPEQLLLLLLLCAVCNWVQSMKLVTLAKYYDDVFPIAILCFCVQFSDQSVLLELKSELS